MWRRAEVAVQIVADVLSVEPTNVRQNKNLGPDSTEVSCSIRFFTRCIRGKLGGLAKCHHCVWGHVGNQFGNILANAKRLMTLGTVGGIACNDRFNSCCRSSNNVGAIGNVTDGGRIVDRVCVDIRDVVRVCQIKWEGEIQYRVIDGGLRLFGRCWMHIVA